jgi:hypothetical protein
MGRKTVADLERENKELKEKLSSVGDVKTLEDENKALQESVELNKQAKAAAEARLTALINDMDTPTIVNGEVQAEGCVIFKGNEYTEHLKERGIKIVSKFDIETLRTFINSGWSPSMVMEKFGLSEASLQSYVFKLSKKEMRDKPIKLDFKRDIFGREG